MVKSNCLRILGSVFMVGMMFGPTALLAKVEGFVCEDAGEEPGARSCADVACERLGSSGCSSANDLQDVATACISNYSGACLDQTCRTLGQGACRTLSAVAAVAGSCQGVCDNSCRDVACKKIDCASLKDVVEVNLACSGHVSGNCLEQKCDHGRCSTLAGLRAAARYCGSQMYAFVTPGVFTCLVPAFGRRIIKSGDDDEDDKQKCNWSHWSNYFRCAANGCLRQQGN